MVTKLFDDLWPPGFDIDKGFTDVQLKRICSEEFGRSEGVRFYSSPWLYWSSEMYSHGRTLREWLGWPSFLPIPAFSDHGIEHFPELHGPELDTKASVYLTWSKWRLDPPNKKSKLVIGIPHPWITFRRRRGIRVLETARGTLCFVPHRLPGHTFSDYDYEHYIEALTREVERPRALMVAMHDIRMGVVEKLRPLGLPILSAGNTDSPRFVERFYDITRRFSSATSSSVGSQLYFCHELGLRYFLFGEPFALPESITQSMPVPDRIEQRVVEVFSLLNPNSQEEKDKLVNSAMGVSRDSALKRAQVRVIFLFALLEVPAEVIRRLLGKILRPKPAGP